MLPSMQAETCRDYKRNMLYLTLDKATPASSISKDEWRWSDAFSDSFSDGVAILSTSI